MPLQYLKKEVRDEVCFCMQINIKVPYKLISTFWASKFPTSWYYHYLWAWSNILKLYKGTSLLHLYNISRKKLVTEFILCMQININVSTSLDYRFWGKWPILVIFYNMLRKKCPNCFCVLSWCKTFRYFTGVQSCSLLLVFGWLWPKMGTSFLKPATYILIMKWWNELISCWYKFRKVKC